MADQGLMVLLTCSDPHLAAVAPHGGRRAVYTPNPVAAARLADACRQTPPRPVFDRMRLPGEAALRCREKQLKHGVELCSGIMMALVPWAEKLGVSCPSAVA